MQQLSMNFDFWAKPDPKLRFVTHWSSGFHVFETEQEALRFAKRRTEAWVEMVILP